MMLPTVDFCGFETTRLLIGANPFGGFSHQSKERDEAMRAYHSPERILETWDRAWKAGINSFVTNNETPHVIDTVHRYLEADGPMRWIAQVSCRTLPSMEAALEAVAAAGCKIMYFHGGLVDDLYRKKEEQSLRKWTNFARELGLKVGVAGHDVDDHYWIDAMNLVDFHVVPFFNCGSVHSSFGGERFQLDDVYEAVKLINALRKPCIAYKVLGAGRIDAAMGFDFALRHIKPGDVINVGMNRADNDSMVEENAGLFRTLLAGR